MMPPPILPPVEADFLASIPSPRLPTRPALTITRGPAPDGGPALSPFESAMNRFLHRLPSPGGQMGPDLPNQGAAKGQAGGECERALCLPLGGQCYCWSDVWIYGAGVGLVLAGAWMLFSAREGA